MPCPRKSVAHLPLLGRWATCDAWLVRRQAFGYLLNYIGKHCAYPRRDGQAELTRVAGNKVRRSPIWEPIWLNRQLRWTRPARLSPDRRRDFCEIERAYPRIAKVAVTSAQQHRLRRWLQLRFDSFSTAIRPRCDDSTTYVATVCGLLYWGLNKYQCDCG